MLLKQAFFRIFGEKLINRGMFMSFKVFGYESL